VAEAARLLGVSRWAIYELVASGPVPVVRIGRSIKVVRAGLEGWVEAPMQADHDVAPLGCWAPRLGVTAAGDRLVAAVL
jgi:excisionase family DNA binding protein